MPKSSYFFTDIKPLKTYLPEMPMLLRPVLPHIIGRDFIIRPTHFTNCQNVKPTTARIAYILHRRQTRKNEISHIGLYPNDNLYPSFVHTLTDEKPLNRTPSTGT